MSPAQVTKRPLTKIPWACLLVFPHGGLCLFSQSRRHTPYCRRGDSNYSQLNQSHPTFESAGASVSPGFCCFSSSANLCPLPEGSWDQEITEFPSLGFFPSVFFQPHANAVPFPGAVFHQLGLSSPQVLALFPPRQSPARVAFLPGLTDESLESPGHPVHLP